MRGRAPNVGPVAPRGGGHGFAPSRAPRAVRRDRGGAPLISASPGDVANEREALREEIHEWNGTFGDEGVMLLPRMWEYDSVPDLRVRAQGVINRQLVDNADIIGHGHRLGTPTAEADSGTVEEVERVANADKPVMLYFSNTPVVPRSIDTAETVIGCRGSGSVFRPRGLIDEFESIEEFRNKVALILSLTVRDRFERFLRPSSSNQPPPGDELAATVYRVGVERALPPDFSNRLVVENFGEGRSRI